ncbi:MAG: hypothetical protein NT029_17490 [Armatimonadetes bacterium]|nr:hypothetical protein [Armatimonadota bacterium]
MIVGRWSRALAAVALGVAAAPVTCQTPTEAYLRIAALRNEPEAIQVSVTPTARQGGGARRRAKATAPTRLAAHKAAAHAACLGSLRTDPAMAALPMLTVLADLLVANRQEIVKEVGGQTGPERSTVEVQIDRSPEQIEADVRSLALSNFRAVVDLPCKVDGEQRGVSATEEALVAALTDRGFRVFDAAIAAAGDGGVAAAARAGLRSLANLVVCGSVTVSPSQETAGIYSYHADARLRVVKADTAQVVGAYQWSERAFGQDRRQAAREAEQALAATVAAKLPEALLAKLEECPVSVELQSADASDRDKAEAALRALPGVRALERVVTATGVLFRIRSVEKPSVIAFRMGQAPGFRLMEYRR